MEKRINFDVVTKKEGLFLTIASLLIAFVFVISPNLALSAPGGNGAGSIWTTTSSCGTPQNSNHYNVGDTVYINGSGFDVSSTYAWDISGKPGNASSDPNMSVANGNLTTDGNGDFCVGAYTIIPGDDGEYHVSVGNKGDNYQVDGSTAPTTECSDGIDNTDSEDTLVDSADPGCHTDGDANNPNSYDPNDNDESNTVTPPTYQCNDGVDNADAEDTLVDSADPGCHSDGDANNSNSYVPTDNDETDESTPACEDDTTEQIIFSDTTTEADGNPTSVLSYIHTSWKAMISGATWIWSTDPVVLVGGSDESETFTKTFEIAGNPTGGSLEIAADNSYTVTLNGNLLCEDDSEKNYTFGGKDTCAIDASMLVSGENSIEFTVTNWDQPDETVYINPAGLMYKLTVNSNACEPGDENNAPVADAGTDAGITLPTDSVNLDGSGSTDSDGTITSYVWSFVSGPTNVDPNDTVSPTVSGLVEGTYVFKLVVTDNDGATDEDTVSITVNPNNGGGGNDPECSDDIDNADSEDTLVDSADPGCHTDGDANNPNSYDPNDNDETDFGTGGGGGSPECSDDIDNTDSEDTLVDSADPGCHTDGDANNSSSYDPNDNDETDDNNGNGGGGGSSSSRSSHGGGNGGGGEVLGASTSCGIYLTTYMRLGYQNDIEDTKRLQSFLNSYLSMSLDVNGNFGSDTFAAVRKFQMLRESQVLTPWGLTKNEPTGIVYLTTQTDINNIMCPDLNLPIPSPLVNWSDNPNLAHN